MIDTITIDHWHHDPAPNRIEIGFWTHKDGGVSAKTFRNPSPASLDRIMHMIWEYTVIGKWQMTPSAAGSKAHWAYYVQERKEDEA